MNEPDVRNEIREDDDSAVRPIRSAPGVSAERMSDAAELPGLDRQLLDYYGLNEQPFGVTPDPRFLCLGAKHRQALDVLNYSTELNRGFVTLIAKPGMGKTSLLFRYLEGLGANVTTAYLFQTDCSAAELMRYLLTEIDMTGKGMDLPEMRALLGQFLLDKVDAGHRFVLIIDEGQNLDEKVLESVRLLSNFETPSMKLMHIVLAGQPQLADKLAKPSMTQLRQRISFSIRIEPLSQGEVDDYIHHRLWVAGYHGSPLFDVAARRMIAEQSGGIPRVINNMCFCAMSYAWALKQKTIDRKTMGEVLDDLDPQPPIKKEKEFAAPIMPQASMPPTETKVSVVKPLEQPCLTLSPLPNQRRISKIAFVFSAIAVLLWIASQPNVRRWSESSYTEMLDSVRVLLTPANTQSAPHPGAAVDPVRSSTNPQADGEYGENSIGVPRRKEPAATAKDHRRN